MPAATFEITTENIARRLNRRLLRGNYAPELTRELLADWILAHDVLSEESLFYIGAICYTADLIAEKDRD